MNTNFMLCSPYPKKKLNSSHQTQKTPQSLAVVCQNVIMLQYQRNACFSKFNINTKSTLPQTQKKRTPK